MVDVRPLCPYKHRNFLVLNDRRAEACNVSIMTDQRATWHSDHNMRGNRRVALAGELELVESAPLPCRVALPLILVISFAAWALALSLTREPSV